MRLDRLSSRLLGLVFGAGLLTASPVSGQITPLGSTTLAPSGVLAHVAYDDKHQVYLHVWEFQNRVWGRFVGANGAVLGASFIVSTAVASTGFAGRPRVAYSRGSSADEFMVLYASDVNSVNRASNIFGQIVRYTGSGPTAGSMDGGFITISPVFSNSTLLQVLDTVVFNPITSRFLVVWEEAPAGYEVVARHVALDGSPVGSAWNVSESAGSQGMSQAAFDYQRNQYLVSYVGDGGPGQPALGTFARILDGNTGQPTSGVAVLAGGYGIEVSVAYLPARDGFIVTWTAFKPDRTVMARFVPTTYAGTLPDAAYLALDTPGSDGGASVTYDPASQVTVVAAMSDPKYIRGALLSSVGVPQTAAFVLGTVIPATGSYYPTVVSAQGGIVGLIYVIDYTATVLERFQLSPGGGGPPPPPLPQPVKPKTTSRHDFDGDGKSDLVVWRPGSGTWFSVTSSTGYNPAAAGAKVWGSPSFGDVPFTGDVDGDRKADLIVWRASTGTWYWVTSSTGYNDDAFGGKQWGNQSLGDVPMVGDVDGDGKVDLIVWRASTGTWYWLTSSSGYSYAAQGAKQWGSSTAGDVPKVGDIDGDGKADLIVWRAPTGTWYWLTSASGFDYAVSGISQWGNQGAGDVPFVADIDGDGKTDLIVWRAPTGTWHWLTSASGFAAQGQKQWGSVGDVPLLTDFDGDGKTDLAVWRASNGTWYWLTSTSGYAYSAAGVEEWGSGALGDIPIIR